MTSPELNESSLNKLRLQLRRSFAFLSTCVPILKQISEPSAAVLASLENLADQYQCCSKVDVQNIPLCKGFPDLQGKLLYKITIELEKEFSKLRKSLIEIEKQSETISKQYDTCMRHHRQHSSCRDLPEIVKRNNTCPSIADMLGWLQNAERRVREQYLCKKYLLETFGIGNERQFVRSWSDGDKEMIDILESYLSWTAPFMEQKIS